MSQSWGDSPPEAPGPRPGDVKSGPGCAPDGPEDGGLEQWEPHRREQAVLGYLPLLNPAQRWLFQASAVCTPP